MDSLPKQEEVLTGAMRVKQLRLNSLINFEESNRRRQNIPFAYTETRSWVSSWKALSRTEDISTEIHKREAPSSSPSRGAGSGCTPGEHDARFPIYMRLFREPKRDLPQHLTHGRILIPSKPIAGKGHEGRKSDATRRSVRTSDANPGRLRSQ